MEKDPVARAPPPRPPCTVARVGSRDPTRVAAPRCQETHGMVREPQARRTIRQTEGRMDTKGRQTAGGKLILGTGVDLRIMQGDLLVNFDAAQVPQKGTGSPAPGKKDLSQRIASSEHILSHAAPECMPRGLEAQRYSQGRQRRRMGRTLKTREEPGGRRAASASCVPNGAENRARSAKQPGLQRGAAGA